MPKKTTTETESPTVPDYTQNEIFNVYGMSEQDYTTAVEPAIQELHTITQELTEDHTAIGKVVDLLAKSDDMSKFTIIAILMRNLEEHYGQQAMIRSLVMASIQPYLDRQLGMVHHEMGQVKNVLTKFLSQHEATAPSNIIQMPGSGKIV